MDFSESFFKWMFQGAKNRRDGRFSGVSVRDLSEGSWLRRLELMAALLEGGPVRIVLSDALEASSPGFWLFPRRIGLGQDDDEVQLIGTHRLLMLHGAGALGLCSDRGGAECSPTDLIHSAIRMPEIRAGILEKYPGAAAVFSAVLESFERASALFLAGDSSFEVWSDLIRLCLGDARVRADAVDISTLVRKWSSDWVGNPHCPLHYLLPPLRRSVMGRGEESGARGSDFPKGSGLTGSEKKPADVRVKTVSRPEVKELDREAESPLTHVFEKVLTAEEYRGGSKKQDGSDESADHSDALSELTLDRVIRGGVPSETMVRSEALFSAQAPELEEGEEPFSGVLHRYPEWFEREKRYRQDHCRLFEDTVKVGLLAGATAGEGYESAALHLTQKLSAFLNESRWRTGQKDGPELDLDAVVRLRSQPPQSRPDFRNFYIGRKRLERDIAILILLDGSLSTDGWVGDRRIIEIMKSSIHLIGNAFSGLDDRFGVAAFNSQTRANCRFSWIKRFSEDWSVEKGRMSGVQPEGYTRIGPALRHAGSVLDGIRARRKLILLFSDAKPSDYDRYEGPHGMADVAKAVSEFRARGIKFKGVAVARDNPSELSRMFGSGNYQVLREPGQVGECVFRVFSEMMKG